MLIVPINLNVEANILQKPNLFHTITLLGMLQVYRSWQGGREKTKVVAAPGNKQVSASYF